MLSAKQLSPYFRGFVNVDGGKTVSLRVLGVGSSRSVQSGAAPSSSYVGPLYFRSACFKTKVQYSRLRTERAYSLCCPPRPPPGECGCPPHVPGGGRRIVPPTDCRPGRIPPNPCCPRFHHGKDTYKKYKYIFLFICLPLILIQLCNVWGLEPPHKGPCREYEYMRRRTKRFPWGAGNESFFHNPHVNHLPEECEPPPLICDDD